VHIVPTEMTNVSCFTSYACVDHALHVGSCDCDRLHVSTLPYVSLL
jgi:hypothetical protein